MRRLLAVAALFALGACGDQEPTKPVEPTANDLLGGLFSGPKLVECPTDEAGSASGLILPLVGGTVSVGGTSVVVPAGAVLTPTNITLTVPASKYVEVEIRANGQEHFLFELPVTVRIDYSRCNRTDILFKLLSAWYIDSESKALLEKMLGVDNKLTRSVTFTTPHLSGYAIAF